MRPSGAAAPLQTVARALRVPFRGLLRDFDDVRRYTWHAGTCLVLMYAVLGAAIAGVMTPWLLLLVPPLYVRSALHVHELMHVRSERQVPLLHRLMMALESPFCLGYREHRDIHLRHHRYCATEEDPEFFQIRGGHARAFVVAMVSPEWMLVDYVRRHGASRAFLIEAGVRFVVFLGVCTINPVAFACYWAVLRVSVGVSQYAFHHALHQRNGELGTYGLRLSPPLERLLAICVGSECVHILTEHPAHHAWQVVKPGQLPVVAMALEPVSRLIEEDAMTRADGAAGLRA